jgi:hypothetical protein
MFPARLDVRLVANTVLGVIFFVGCSSVKQVSEPDKPSETAPTQSLEAVLDAQEHWLLGFKAGQSLQDITVPTSVSDPKIPSAETRSGSYYSLEVTDSGRLYQYIQGAYPRTHVLYGLYFDDGELTALLLDQDVVDFYVCEEYFRHGGYRVKGPSLYTIEAVNDWVRERNRLGTNFNARMVHQNTRPSEGKKEMDSSETIEAIAHIPLAVVAAPFVGISLLPPFRQLAEKQEKEQERKRREWAEKARQIHPGSVTEGDLLKMMGPPASKFAWPGGSGWVYGWPHDPYSLSFGIKDGIVMWKVNQSKEGPGNIWTVRRDNEGCGVMSVER